MRQENKEHMENNKHKDNVKNFKIKEKSQAVKEGDFHYMKNCTII